MTMISECLTVCVYFAWHITYLLTAKTQRYDRGSGILASQRVFARVGEARRLMNKTSLTLGAFLYRNSITQGFKILLKL